MSREPGLPAGSETNFTVKPVQPEYISQEPVVRPPTSGLLTIPDKSMVHPLSVGQYVPLEQPDAGFSGGGYKNPSSKITNSGEKARALQSSWEGKSGRKLTNSGEKTKVFQRSWEGKSGSRSKRNSEEKNKETCCDFCCLCAANFCLHLH